MWEKIVVLGLLLTTTGSAFALGLGNASGQAILGQPLLIEISLLGSDDGIPSAECFRIRPPLAEIESGFVLRNAQIQLFAERGHAKLIVSTTSPVHEPVIEFGVTVACGFELSRDYLLLSSEPTKTTVLPALPVKSSALAIAEAQGNRETAPQAKAAAPAAATDNILRIQSDITLKALARKNYPLQPKAREKFMRMMAQANPHLGQDEYLISAGSELQLPPGLPVRRQGAYHSLSKTLSSEQGASNKPNVASKAKKPAPAKPPRDLLVLGEPARRSASELLSEAERLTTLLMEQTNTQDAVAEKITQLETTLGSIKQHFSSLENRIHTIEVERQAERLAAKPASRDFVELLLAVLAGGAIGALTLYAFNLIRSRRDRSASPSAPEGDMSSATLAASIPVEPRGEALPWEHKSPLTDKARPASPGMDVIAEKQSPGGKDEPLLAPPSSPQHDFDFVSKRPS